MSIYLFIYISLCVSVSSFFRWGMILMNTLQYISNEFSNIGLSNGVPELYELVKNELLIFQSLAILEVSTSTLKNIGCGL